MAKRHVTREDLKRDEVHDFGAKLLHDMNRHRTTILITVLAAVCVIAAVKIYSTYRYKRTVEANQQLATAYSAFMIAMQSNTPDERDAGFDRAAALSSSLRNAYPGTSAGRRALLLQGAAHYYNNNFTNAIARFNEYRETTGDPDRQARAAIALGFCYEQEFFNSLATSSSGDRSLGQQALEYYDQAAERAKNRAYTHQALLGKARMFEATGQLREAVDIYQGILDDLEEQKAADRNAFLGDSAEEMMPLMPFEALGAETTSRQQIDWLTALIESGNIETAQRRAAPAAAGDDGTTVSLSLEADA